MTSTPLGRLNTPGSSKQKAAKRHRDPLAAIILAPRLSGCEGELCQAPPFPTTQLQPPASLGILFLCCLQHEASARGGAAPHGTRREGYPIDTLPVSSKLGTLSCTLADSCGLQRLRLKGSPVGAHGTVRNTAALHLTSRLHTKRDEANAATPRARWRIVMPGQRADDAETLTLDHPSCLDAPLELLLCLLQNEMY